jgi:hypothetical protein
MPRDAGKRDQRIPATPGTQIGSTEPDSAHTQQRLSLRAHGLGYRLDANIPRTMHYHSFHSRVPFDQA